MRDGYILEDFKTDVIKDYQNGDQIKSIAAKYKFHRTSISNALKLWGVREDEKQRRPSSINREKDYDTLRQLFNDGLTPQELAVRYNVTDQIIKYHLRKMKIDLYRGKIINRKEIFEDTPEMFKQLYLSGCSIEQIEEETGYDHSTVHRNLVKLGVDTSFKKYEVDEHFFEQIDTEEKAWILGLIFSDGGLVKTSFRVNLQIDDIDTLEKMKSALKYEGPILIQKPVNTNYKDIAYLSIGRKKMVEDLIKLGCGYRKSLTLEWPVCVPDNLIQHFLRGYFDGDGCIKVDHKQISVIFSGSKIFNEKLLEYLNKLDIYSSIRDIGLISHLCIQRKHEAIKLCNYIYKDATIYMNRKYNTWNDYKTKFSDICTT